MITTPTPLLTLYLDDGCPVWTREIGFYQRRRGAGSLRRVNLAHDRNEAGACPLPGRDMNP
jgi:hypothetical protein